MSEFHFLGAVLEGGTTFRWVSIQQNFHQILHNHCFQFLLGITVVLSEI